MDEYINIHQQAQNNLTRLFSFSFFKQSIHNNDYRNDTAYIIEEEKNSCKYQSKENCAFININFTG